MGEGVQVNLKTAFLTEISWTNNSNFKLQCKHTYTWMRRVDYTVAFVSYV